MLCNMLTTEFGLPQKIPQNGPNLVADNEIVIMMLRLSIFYSTSAEEICAVQKTFFQRSTCKRCWKECRKKTEEANMKNKIL